MTNTFLQRATTVVQAAPAHVETFRELMSKLPKGKLLRKIEDGKHGSTQVAFVYEVDQHNSQAFAFLKKVGFKEKSIPSEGLYSWEKGEPGTSSGNRYADSYVRVQYLELYGILLVDVNM